jgi:hypothetical protein
MRLCSATSRIGYTRSSPSLCPADPALLPVPKVSRIFTLATSPSSLAAMYGTCQPYSGERPKSADSLSQYTTDNAPCPVGQLVFNTLDMQPFKASFNELHPFATDTAFGAYQPPTNRCRVIPVLPSTLLPAFTGRNFYTTTGSSATLHRFDRP